MIFVAFTTSALAGQTAQLGEDKGPPKKPAATACKYARKAKAIDANSATKTEKVKAPAKKEATKPAEKKAAPAEKKVEKPAPVKK